VTIALNTVYYPEHQWTQVRSNNHKVPLGYWNDINNQRAFFDKMASLLNVQKEDDWYSVSVKSVIQHGGSFIKRHYNGSIIRGESAVCHH
jgi:hypothetical protein